MTAFMQTNVQIIAAVVPVFVIGVLLWLILSKAKQNAEVGTGKTFTAYFATMLTWLLLAAFGGTFAVSEIHDHRNYVFSLSFAALDLFIAGYYFCLSRITTDKLGAKPLQRKDGHQ